MVNVQVVFMGTGGGRFTTVTQRLRTGGIRLLNKEFNFHLDPGPGALVHAWELGLDPRKINGIFVSHSHPDHYGDAEILIEAMTGSTINQKGVLAASKSVLRGGETAEASISQYHQTLPQLVMEVNNGTEFTFAGVKIIGTTAKHSDTDAVGFRFHTPIGDIGYTSDTELYEGIEQHYRGVRLLILCVLRPTGEPWQGHMTTDDAIEIVRVVKPECAVLTHFGMRMLFKSPTEEAKHVWRETGVRTIAARDDMQISIDESIVTGASRKRDAKTADLDTFMG